MLENAIRDVWRRSRSNMHEYGNNSEGLSSNLISTTESQLQIILLVQGT